MRLIQYIRSLLLLAPVAAVPTVAWADGRPVVLELFTSQGCSSCPPADALVKKLSADPSILPLTYHVNYWDQLGWKDPYSSSDNTARQHAYVKLVHELTLYTPQIMVDGAVSVVGSDDEKVRAALADMRKDAFDVPISITPSKTDGSVRVRVTGADMNQKELPREGTVWQIVFSRGGKTKVGAGENQGRTLDSVNDVQEILQLGTWQRNEHVYRLPLKGENNDGVAILLQENHNGRILGAAVYVKPAKGKG